MRYHVSIAQVRDIHAQAWKRRCLSGTDLAPPQCLTFVPVDFEWDNLQQKLSSAGFQCTSCAFFTWLGVVPYLTRDAIDTTLGYIASIPNSEVVFDYAEAPETFTEDVKTRAAARMAQLEKMNEEWGSRFEPAGVAALLRSHRFGNTEDLSFQQVVSRFGRDVQGLATGQVGVPIVHAKHWSNQCSRGRPVLAGLARKRAFYFSIYDAPAAAALWPIMTAFCISSNRLPIAAGE